MIQPFVSVVVISYNYGHLLPRALEAISRQTFRDFEVIIVNNGSSDNTQEIAEQFIEEHPDIQARIVRIEVNQGLAYGDNMGTTAATGKYILLNDADDWMDDNTLEVLAKAAKETDADRVIGSFRDVNDDGKVVKVRNVGKKPIMWLHTMQQANLFRTEIYHKNNIQLECFWNDAEKIMLFSQFVTKVAFVEKPCYNYLVHMDSYTRNKEVYKRMWNEKESIELLLKRFRMVYDAVKTQEDQDWAEYQTIRCYYSYMFQYLRDAPLKEKWRSHKKMYNIMLNYFPLYWKNPKISLFRTEGDQFSSRLVFWSLTKLERWYLMPVVLLAYHLMSKMVFLHF